MTERSEHPRLAHQIGAREGAALNYEGERVMLRRDVAGVVDVPSGELLVCDPRGRSDDVVAVRVPQASYRAYVTSFRGEYAEVRQRITATLAIRLLETGGITLAPLGSHALTPPVEDPDDPEDADLHFVGVEGPAVLVGDRRAWSPVDYGGQLPDGIAEQVSLAGDVRAVRVASGLGSGGYPVFGGFDVNGDLSVVYVAFDMVFEGEPESWQNATVT